MEAQLQIRRNVMEVQDAVKDILNWEKDVKLKGMKSSKQSSSQPSTASTAPIRGKAATIAPAAADQTQKTAASSKQSTTSSKPVISSISDNNLTAEGWKERGNDLFKAGQFRDAKDCYTKSLVLQPTSVVYANRGLACLKLQEFAQAEEDCSKSIRLDPTYLKAYQRRATARKSLDKMKLALEDFEYALRLEPNSQAIKADRDACLAAVMKGSRLTFPTKPCPVTIIDETPASKTKTTVPVSELKDAVQESTRPEPASSPEGYSQPQASTAGQFSKPASKPDVAAELPASAGQNATTAAHGQTAGIEVSTAVKQTTENNTANLESGSSTEKDTTISLSDKRHNAQNSAGVLAPELASSSLQQDAVLPSNSQEAQGVANQSNSTAATQPDSSVQVSGTSAVNNMDGARQEEGAGNGAVSTQGDMSNNSSSSSSSQQQPVTPGVQGSGSSKGTVKYIESIAKAVVASREPAQKAPRTSTDFYAAWRGMKGDLKEQAAYLSLIKPEQLPLVLKNSLTADLLTAMVKTLLQQLLDPTPCIQPDDCVQYLEQLPKVPRFDMNVMCMMPKDKNSLKVLVQSAVTDSRLAALQSRLEGVQKKYRLT